MYVCSFYPLSFTVIVINVELLVINIELLYSHDISNFNRFPIGVAV